ncbi:RNA polymerase sigma factor rpoD [Tetrabaena socialis]|uniref:RNA polymerase sigma factor rpoD n=1 Tax=Tetrabaena socialis TaxID=47790 RepID=A0A2J7ZZM1_9CHLO|nr:RNA polymerase sigma factor rpoD [Tetrabaena socialis]|eukprot:PNH05713.1 RNA polymerase sigma factor rpoD [Tetrabaena socialis]
MRAVAAPTRQRQSSSAVPELLETTHTERSTHFQEYSQATQLLARLDGRASSLEELLDQLNACEAGLDDALLAPPLPEGPADPAMRRANRAAKRAERKAVATPAEARRAEAAPAPGRATLAVVAEVVTAVAAEEEASTSAAMHGGSAPAVIASSSGLAEPAEAQPGSAGAVSDVQHLEELFKLTVGEPELPQPSARAVLVPRRAAKKQSAAAAAREAATAAAAREAATAVAAREAATAAAAAAAATAAAAAAKAAVAEAAAAEAAAAEAKAVAAAAVAAATAAEAEAAAAAAAMAAPAQVPAAESLAQRLERLLRSHAHPGAAEEAADQHEELDSQAGPSKADLLALEREGEELSAAEEAEQRQRVLAAAHHDLEASARVARSPQQLSVMPTGPSLLHLVSSPSAAPGRTARVSQARRTARNGGGRAGVGAAKAASTGASARGQKVAKDGTVQFLSSSNATAYLDHDLERDVTEVCRDFLFLEKVKRQCCKTLHRQALPGELAAAVGMDVTLPVKMIEQLTKLKSTAALLQELHKREPTTAELAAELGLSVARVELMLDVSRSANSLDMPIGSDDGESTMKDAVEDDRAASDEVYGNNTLKEDMESMLAELPEREALVVRMRFGLLEDGKEYTLEEIGDVLQVTRERIRQIEAKALRKLKVRTIDESGKLKEYSDNLDMLEGRDVAARTSSGTRKT